MVASLWASPDVQRVLKLLFIIALGKLLQARFPGKDANVVQTLLLQFLVPATLFKGLSKETIELSHMKYVAGGVLFVCSRTLASLVASYGVLGGSMQSERAALRRTAIFEISTTASALSVLPFITAFLGDSWVGSAAIVDLPMKLYMLILMPVFLKMFGENSGGGDDGPGISAALEKLLKDPITLSLLFGILVAVVTDGGGTKALGFAGKAVDALAEAQTPVLFLLIGLKLSFTSSTPLFCVVLLLATQGILLIMVNLLVLLLNPDESMAMFIAFFAQGAPSVVGMGVITQTIKSGVKGYSSDFAFDIVGMAFPISSLMQCSVGVVGTSYPKTCGAFGVVLLLVAAAIRIGCDSVFKVKPDVDPESLQTGGSNTQLANKS
jgi:hypothetical protein